MLSRACCILPNFSLQNQPILQALRVLRALLESFHQYTIMVVKRGGDRQGRASVAGEIVNDEDDGEDDGGDDDGDDDEDDENASGIPGNSRCHPPPVATAAVATAAAATAAVEGGGQVTVSGDGEGRKGKGGGEEGATGSQHKRGGAGRGEGTGEGTLPGKAVCFVSPLYTRCRTPVIVAGKLVRVLVLALAYFLVHFQSMLLLVCLLVLSSRLCSCLFVMLLLMLLFLFPYGVFSSLLMFLLGGL